MKSFRLVYHIAITFIFWREAVAIEYRSETFLERTELGARYSYSSLIQETFLRSNIKCGMQCVSNINCESFFYNTNTKTCLLTSRIWTDTVDTNPEVGWTYFVKQEYTQGSSISLSNSSLNIIFHDANGTMRNYSMMQEVCQNEGGQLLKIMNDVERLDIANFLQNHPTSSTSKHVMFQGTEQRPSGIWYFDDGSEISYLPWATDPQQPNTDTHNCLYLKSPYLFWWDGACEANAAFICQI